MLTGYGQAHDLPHLEAWGNQELGFAFYRRGNISQLQTYVLKAAAILDKYPDNFLQGENANMYAFFQPTDSLQIFYEKKAITYLASARENENRKVYLSSLNANISRIFLDENRIDSALAYAQTAYDIFISYSAANANGESVITSYLSIVYARLHQYDLAAAYAKMSLAGAHQSQNAEDFNMAYKAMAIYFISTHRQDSAFYYWSKMYNESSIGFYKAKITAANWLYKYYKQKHNADSALKYASFYIAAGDSLNNVAQTQQVEKINLQEDTRRQQLAAQAAKEKETENRNIQFAILAIGILVCVILFLLMSRSFMVSHKTIEILGVIMLLVVFEFINLLLHDYLEGITHNSPFVMLLILVAVAAFIVPLHHRLERWATRKLVEKNKEVRLTKAKKIVAQLECKS